MSATSKRTTIYFNPTLYEALRLRSVETGQSVSELVNEAVRTELAEDVEDLTALESRKEEPAISFEDFVRELKDRGRL